MMVVGMILWLVCVNSVVLSVVLRFCSCCVMLFCVRLSVWVVVCRLLCLMMVWKMWSWDSVNVMGSSEVGDWKY